jgi:hypothetical protein
VQPTSRYWRTSKLGVCPESNRRAEMTMTTAVKARGTTGDMGLKVVDFTFDNAYPTGGWPVIAQQCGFGVNGQVLYVDITSAKLGYLLEYDHVANKIKAYQNGTGNAPNAELANNSAVLSGVVGRAVVFGKGSPG